MTYQDYLNSEGWKAKRAMILNMWGNRCALCNEGGELHLHHRTYERKGNEDPFDLVPLCKKHHEMVHENDIPKEKEISIEDKYLIAIDRLKRMLDLEPESREGILRNIDGVIIMYERVTGKRYIP
jgi:hypothetical protein